MIDQCTCRVTPRERHLNPQCPIHGDAEMRRRHEAARQAAAEGARLYESLDARGRRIAWNLLLQLKEGRCHEIR